MPINDATPSFSFRRDRALLREAVEAADLMDRDLSWIARDAFRLWLNEHADELARLRLEKGAAAVGTP